jgi:hypothetical protein
MPDDLARPKLGSHGGKRPGAGRPRKGETREKKQGDDVTSKSQRGHSVDYLRSRLLRDGHIALVEAIDAHRISTFTAAEAVGYVGRPPPRGTGSDNQAKKRAWDVKALIG